jgi:D-glycero-alpha-D-manno-heptose-7-phosphate kinase
LCDNKNVILVRSPLRISLGGGGTDLPTYYERFGGLVVSASINKYVYVAISKPFSEKIILKYSNYECVENIVSIRHPIIREVLSKYGIGKSGIEISTIADAPAGTGLGSSGSFTTAIIKAVNAHLGYEITVEDLASSACQIEIEKLSEPIGKQDQYIAAYGGISMFRFLENGEVKVEPLNLQKDVVEKLENNLLLFYTGNTRSASLLLQDQVRKTLQDDEEMINNLNYIKEIGVMSFEALKSGNLDHFGNLMNEHWEYKKSRTDGMSNTRIDDAYKVAMNAGAVGGKLVGAGGGGFLMFYTNDPSKLRFSMSSLGLEEMKFGFDFSGTSVVVSK